MPDRTLVIGSRASALALAQARLIRAQLEAAHPRLRCSLVSITARADQDPNRALSAFEGEGIFVKELEAALVERRIDLAVHSLKDMPLAMPEGLCLAAVPPREDPRDAWVSRERISFADLPAGSRVGTSSLRRSSQLLNRRPDLVTQPIRGNVDTRLRKLADGAFDAIVLAAAGLIRLSAADRITEYLDPEWMLPEPGQGALAVQARSDDAEAIALAGVLDHAATRQCVLAERALLGGLGGGCRLPIAALAVIEKNELRLRGAVVSPDGKRAVREAHAGEPVRAESLGKELAQRLAERGAADLLRG